jgi:hypothetical protein
VGSEEQWCLTWLENDANNAEYQRRSLDIDQIYTSPDSCIVSSLIAHCKAQYLYIDLLEIVKCSNAKLYWYCVLMHGIDKAKGY